MNSYQRLKFQRDCLLAAAQAHGDTDKAKTWYEQYRPDLMEFRPTMQYSLSCFLMNDAIDMCKNQGKLTNHCK